MVHGAFETRESGASTSTAASDVDSELTETTTILLIKSSFSTGNLRLEKCATKPCIYVRLVNTKNFSPIAQHRDNKLSVARYVASRNAYNSIGKIHFLELFERPQSLS